MSRRAVAIVGPVEPDPPLELQSRRFGPPRKWERGRQLSLVEFDTVVANPDTMLWYERPWSRKPGRPISAGYVRSWSYWMARNDVYTGALRLAHVRGEYMEWLRDELLGKERTS